VSLTSFPLPFPELIERLLHQLASQGLLLFGRQGGVACHVHDAMPQHHPVGSHHFCDGQCGSHLYDGNAGLLELGRNRSTAARARTSRRGQYDGVHALLFHFLRHLSTQSTGIRQWIGQARGGQKLVVNLTNHTLVF